MLEGDGTPSEEWLIGQVCKAFGCTPAEALAQPAELTLTIMEQWSFAETYFKVRDAEADDDVPNTPLARLAGDILADRVRERLAARKAARKVP